MKPTGVCILKLRLHTVPKYTHFYFVFLVPQAVPTAVRTCTWRNKKMKKPVKAIMADVGNEVYAARQSFTNKASVSFILSEPLIIINDQWIRKYEAHRSFIGEAMSCGISFIIDIDDVDVNQFFIFFCSCVSSRTRTYTCRHGLRDQKK